MTDDYRHVSLSLPRHQGKRALADYVKGDVPVVPVVLFDEARTFLAAQRLRARFPDEWEDMHRQALRIAEITPLSYEQAVDRIIRREPMTTAEAFEAFGRAWQRLVKEVNDALEDLFGGPVKVWAEKLREAGLLPEVPPEDPRERALWAKQHRSTGPARPSGQNAHAPRRLK